MLNKGFYLKVLLSFFLFFFVINLSVLWAVPVSFSTYDIYNGRPLQYTNLRYATSYSGDMTATGNGTDNAYTAGYLGTYDFTGGYGTFNDGVVASNYRGEQWFYREDNSVITLNLDHFATINYIELYSSNNIYDVTTIFQLYTEINGTRIITRPDDFGPESYSQPWQRHERIVLSGTALESIVTNQISLGYRFLSSTNFGISEIVVDGNYISEPVPEPSTILLMGIGLLGLAAIKSRKQKS